MIPSQQFFKIATVSVAASIVGLLGVKKLRPTPPVDRSPVSETMSWRMDGSNVSGNGESLVAARDPGAGDPSVDSSNRERSDEVAADPDPPPSDVAVSAEPGGSDSLARPMAVPPRPAADRSPSRSSEPDAAEPRSEPILNVGRIGSAPRRDQLLSIDRLPSTESEVIRGYQAAANRASRILPPNGDVRPQLQRSQGRSGTLGRVTALTIGLELNADAAKSLPGPTRSQVLQYFRDHRLAVQPIIYHDASGAPYFGIDTASAFYRVDRPARTLRPEPMIGEAVDRFRTLGVVSDHPATLGSTNRDPPESEVASGRTLAMAFSFSQAIGPLLDAPTRTVHELLLLHLPLTDAVTDNAGQDVVSLNRREIPNLEVFITSDDRTILHQVLGDAQLASSGGPAMSAQVRFDDMTMMGLYPARPVVTEINYRRGGSISMSILERFMEASTPVSLPAILDRFSDLARAPIATQDPMEKLRRQRLRALDEVINRGKPDESL